MAIGGNIESAAIETGKQALNLNQQQTEANRPNQYNAWGGTEWTRNNPYQLDAQGNPVLGEDGQPQLRLDPVTGKPITEWTQTEFLADPLQNALNAQMNIGEGRSELAQGMMGRVWDNYQDPMDFGQFGDINQLEDRSQFDYDVSGARSAAEDAAYQKSANRLDPRFQRQEQQLMNKLRNQGLTAGDQAYDAAMNNFNIGRNDAYEQARLGATSEGRSEADLLYGQALQQNQTNFGQGVQQNAISNALRQQAINEGVAFRNYDLNEMNNMLQGQMIQGGPPSTGAQTGTNQGTQSTPFNVNIAG